MTVPSDLVALMSAVGTGSSVDPKNPEKKIYTFTQKVLLITTMINRGYYIPARGYELYLRVFNSISHK